MSAPPDHNDPAARPSRIDWPACALAIAIVLAFAVALCPNNVDSDLWGHVLYGQDVLRDGELPATARYTFTAEGYRWINHENLAELAIAFGIESIGVTGMLALKALAGLLMIGLMMRHALRRNTKPLIAVAILMLVAVTLTAFWAMRPQVFSYVLLAVMIALLNRAFARWSDTHQVEARWLLPIPVLFVVWANSHGAFVAGLCLLAAYLGCRTVEAIYFKRLGSWLTCAALATIGLASLLATFATPYGGELWAWLLTTLSQPRPENSEWIPPSMSHDFFLPFVLVIATFVIAWLGTQRRRDWVHFALISLCVWQSMSHLRHIALLAILVGFWIPEHVQSLRDRFRKSESSAPLPRMQSYVMAGFLTIAIVVVGLRLQSRFRGIEVRRDDYPVAALQFMNDNDLNGKLVVSFSWAQYAIAALSPDVEVAFDGRFRTCYPQEIIDMHFDFQIGAANGKRARSPQSGPLDGHRVLKFEQPDLVLVDRRFPHGVRMMETQDDFALLYQDALAQVWGRTTKFDVVSSKSHLPVESRQISDVRQTGSVSWPAFPVKRM